MNRQLSNSNRPGRQASRGQRLICWCITPRRRGSAMVMAIVYVAIFAMIVSYVMLATNRQTRNTYRSRLFSTTLAASATIVKSMTQQAYYMATTRPAQLSGSFDNLGPAIESIKIKKVPGYTAVKEGNKDLVFLKPGANNGELTEITDADDDWAGYSIRRWSYDAYAFLNAAYDPENPDVAEPEVIDPNAQRLGFQGAGFKAGLEINYIPLYQYAIFYDNDLELHTGEDINVNGAAHSNRNMWLATTQQLTFHGRVTAAGDVRSYRDFSGIGDISKIDAESGLEKQTHKGTVRIKKKEENGNTFLDLNDDLPDDWDTNNNTFLDSGDTEWMENALARYAGNLKDTAMGVKPISPPLPFVEGDDGKTQAAAGDLIQRADDSDSSDMRQHKMEYMADYVIEGDPTAFKEVRDINNNTYLVPNDDNFKIINKTGIDYGDFNGNENGNGNGNGSEATIKNYITNEDGELLAPPLVTVGSFHDNRQDKLVNTFDLNFEQIIESPLEFPTGMLYASAEGGEMAAVRVTRADEIPANVNNAFTIATDRPMYLEGDVNKGSNRKTLLLAADAITVTSQKLTEELTEGNKIPAASSTETNAIFMLGQVSSKYEDTSGELIDHYLPGAKRIQMSGGAHNVLRYLEKWEGNDTHTYNGSLICLFESRIATGNFWRMDGDKHISYYDPPKRAYKWDLNFKNDPVPPPGMPVLVEVKLSNLERINRQEAVAALP